MSRISAVGIFLQDRSPYGVMDLAGNVWDWCLNEYKHSERTQREGDEPRVLRGGSRLDRQDGARADYRRYFLPGFRSGGRGFRVVCAAPISSAR